MRAIAAFCKSVLVFCLALSALGWAPLQAAPVAPDVAYVPSAVGLSLSPDGATIQGCQTLAVEVRVANAVDLYGVDVRLAFDASMLEVVDANPTKTGIQVQDGHFLSPDFVVSREADNVAGKVEYVMTQAAASQPVTGSGVLFTVLFRAKSTATATALVFAQTDLVDLDGTLMSVTAVNSTISSAAPADSALGIAKLTATDARLSWSASAGASSYRLHRNTAPYFVPVAPPYQTVGALSYDDLGAVGNPAANNYYIVATVCANGFGSQPSNRVGEFDYSLVPGASS